MQVTAGTRLGPYEIVSRLGAGGMGEVWRARDTRLDRSVAIKIVPPELAHRFEREAKAISQLNHPHICVVHDVGENYLVMELLEGEMLADRIARGALPLRDVVALGVQIAGALDRAHRAGIVHRDLKPGNIMLTKGGAKLLDFGLAKQAAPPVSLDGATEVKPLTAEGTIVGTFQYMAPEQLEGRDADARTDIFALGAVLYEMATGKRAFEGKTKTSLIAAIVAGEPTPMSQMQPLTPPALEHLVMKCLAKDPEERWQSTHDIAEELRWISAGTGAAVAKPRPAWLPWAVPAIAIAAVVAFVLRPRPAALPRVEAAILPPEGRSFVYTSGTFALSPNGRQLAFIARGPTGPRALWVRSLGSSVVRPLPGTERPSHPFWSADGKFVLFFSSGKLMKVAAGGGAAETIAEIQSTDGTCNGDGDILIVRDRVIERIPAAGGNPVRVSEASTKAFAPSFLPDGRHFLVTRITYNREPVGVFAGSLDGKPERLVLPGVYSKAVYVPPGLIVYAQQGELRARHFDAKALQATGDPIRLVDRVQFDPNLGSALFAVSERTLVYAPGDTVGKSQLTWVSRGGKDLAVVAPPSNVYFPRLSHDEKRVAVDVSDGRTDTGDIWLYDFLRGIATRLTWDPGNETAPLWMPDDKRIVYVSAKRGHSDFYLRSSGGTGSEETLLADDVDKFPYDTSSDGRWLLFSRTPSDNRTVTELWLLDLSAHKARPWLTSPFWVLAPRFSPDGKWIAYSSRESGRNEIYIQAFPEAASKTMVSRGGGRMPVWRGDGRELYYLSDDHKMMAVPLTLQPALDAGTPVPLFETRLQVGDRPQYDVTRDGQRFLVDRVVGDEGTHLTLVQNWQN